MSLDQWVPFASYALTAVTWYLIGVASGERRAMRQAQCDHARERDRLDRIRECIVKERDAAIAAGRIGPDAVRSLLARWQGGLPITRRYTRSHNEEE